ncbi:hypothetical protein HDU96_001041 [Phlyctochytrium bullatum]|nr:hypothetical protein HDU96_001041 [Phlyctochytrium bullatum]
MGRRNPSRSTRAKATVIDDDDNTFEGLNDDENADSRPPKRRKASTPRKSQRKAASTPAPEEDDDMFAAMGDDIFADPEVLAAVENLERTATVSTPTKGPPSLSATSPAQDISVAKRKAEHDYSPIVGINRSPVLCLWAALCCKMERPRWNWRTALSFGKAIMHKFCETKAASLGLCQSKARAPSRSAASEAAKWRAFEKRRRGIVSLEVYGTVIEAVRVWVEEEDDVEVSGENVADDDVEITGTGDVQESSSTGDDGNGVKRRRANNGTSIPQASGMPKKTGKWRWRACYQDRPVEPSGALSYLRGKFGTRLEDVKHAFSILARSLSEQHGLQTSSLGDTKPDVIDDPDLLVPFLPHFPTAPPPAPTGASPSATSAAPAPPDPATSAALSYLCDIVQQYHDNTVDQIDNAGSSVDFTPNEERRKRRKAFADAAQKAYVKFRPDIPDGLKGWGAGGILELEQPLMLATAGAAFQNGD